MLAADEAAQLERKALENLNADRRDGGAQADLARAYNEVWYARKPVLEQPHLAGHRSAGREGAAAHRGRTADRRADPQPARRPGRRGVGRSAGQLYAMYLARDAEAAPELQQRHPDFSDPRLCRAAVRAVRPPGDPARRPSAPRQENPPVERRLTRPLGGEHARGRHHELLPTSRSSAASRREVCT